MNDIHEVVGTSPLRKEGIGKVRGEAQYVDDLVLPGMWFGATVRSSVARGRIVSVTFDPGVNWAEFAVVTATDIPGENTIVHLTKDHPCLADGWVNHPEEMLMLLDPPDKAAVTAAVRAVSIEYEELPGVFTIEESEAAVAAGDRERIIWGEGEHANTFKSYVMQKGDAESCWAEADYIVEGEYRTGAQEQLYIENNGVIAEYSAEAGVTVRGSMQCPFYLVHALEYVFGLPAEKCRVIQTETGGAFGGQEDFPSVIG